METNVKRIKQIVPMVPKIIIPAEGFISDDLDSTELIQVNPNDNTDFIQNFMREGLDASKLIPVSIKTNAKNLSKQTFVFF